MRKRKETQKGSLSSAQAAKGSTSNEEKDPQKKNVAEQQGEELMNAIGDLLHGKPIDEVISVGMSIALDGIRQKSHGNPLLAIPLFEQAVKATREAFFNLTLKQYIDE